MEYESQTRVGCTILDMETVLFIRYSIPLANFSILFPSPHPYTLFLFLFIFSLLSPLLLPLLLPLPWLSPSPSFSFSFLPCAVRVRIRVHVLDNTRSRNLPQSCTPKLNNLVNVAFNRFLYVSVSEYSFVFPIFSFPFFVLKSLLASRCFLANGFEFNYDLPSMTNLNRK